MPQVTKDRRTSMNSWYAFKNILHQNEENLSFREIKRSQQLSLLGYYFSLVYFMNKFVRTYTYIHEREREREREKIERGEM